MNTSSLFRSKSQDPLCPLKALPLQPRSTWILPSVGQRPQDPVPAGCMQSFLLSIALYLLAMFFISPQDECKKYTPVISTLYAGRGQPVLRFSVCSLNM